MLHTINHILELEGRILSLAESLTRYVPSGSYDYIETDGKLSGLNLSKSSLTNEKLAKLFTDQQIDLSHLTYLNLSENPDLTDIQLPKGLEKLEKLEAYNCGLTKVVFSEVLPHLNWLDLRKNEIEQIHFDGDCPKLTFLDLSENKLHTINLDIGFAAIQQLFLNANQFKIPPALPRISTNLTSQLETLSLRDNQLNELPPNLLAYPQLQSLYLEGNPLESIPQELIKTDEYASANSWEGIRAHLRSLAEDHAVKNKEVKLLFLGNSTAGKSSLLEYLINKTYQPGSASTHGIKNLQWHPEGKDFMVNVWDFGGQEYYHATHRLFLSKNAVSLILFEEKTNCQEEQETLIALYEDGKLVEKLMPINHFPFQYWLNGLQYFSQEEHPVSFLVQNKLDISKRVDLSDRDKKTYRLRPDENSFCISVQATSAGEKRFLRRFEEFEESLFELLEANIPAYDISNKWLEIRNAIRDLPEEYGLMTYAEYEAFCEKIRPDISVVRQGESTSMLDHLTTYLHEIGVILYYKGIASLQDLVFTKPKWITDAIYKVLDYGVQKNEGKFHKEHVSSVIKDFDADKLIDLMKEFELIFEVKNDSNTFVAPQYLWGEEQVRKNHRGFKLNKDRCKEHLFSLKYPRFLPKSVMTRFICRFGKLSENFYWKKGILFDWEGKYVLVENRLDPKDQCETIQIKAEQRSAQVLQLLFNTLHEINNQNPDIQLSVNGEDYIAVGKLHKHPQENPFIETIAGKQIEFEPFLPFSTKIEAHLTVLREILLQEEAPNMQSIKDKVIGLVQKSRLKEALDLLFKHSANKSSVIALQNRLNTLQDQELRGILSFQDAQIERNRILNGILNLIDQPMAEQSNNPSNPTAISSGTSTTPQKVKLFFSYSKHDIEYLEQLKRHLSALRRQGKIEAWDDHDILPGEEWNEEVKYQLQRAHIILLLISSDFLATDYIWDVEIKEAMQRHEQGNATVIPVLIRSCDWEDMPFGKLNSLPSKGKAVSTFADKDQAWLQVVKGIERVIEHKFPS